MAKDGAAKLSKNLLRMKFMQRGLDDEVKKQLEEEEKRVISDDHWYLDLPELKAKENYIIEEKSFVPCEDLVYGRMSFKGFNPEVEKLMLVMNSGSRNEEEEDVGKMESDITDEEMARRYESLVSSMKRTMSKKRERSTLEGGRTQNNHTTRAKKVFLKPQD
ncbi:M-phase phosphoprotein 6 [Denticeps clupeoides]|uniref:M-phase phosphoprotein 6 n=1 Tax=Denticeps clupeoides TaxID=299321 RepID=A0AAY4ACW8_9TELE|nr:M-phase phosphoprotein 6 [Denticeps clupeoides]